MKMRDYGRGTDRTLNLSDVYKLLRETLLITEEVKEILKRDCDEAAFVLKSWQVRAVAEKRVDESSCSCKKIASKNEAEEIAAGIGRAIILAQELREKLKFNVASKKRTSRRDAVESIYLPSVSDRNKKVSRTNLGTQKGNSAKDCKKSIALQGDKATFVATIKSSKSVDRTKQSDATDKRHNQSKTLPAKAATRSRKEKNFILENKLKVKRISSASKLQDDGNNSNDASRCSQKSVTSETSATELSDLIHKVRQSTESALTLSFNSDKTDCPLHGDHTRESVEEQIVTIDVVEALRHFDVPNEIVKVLRIYHEFLTAEANDMNDIKEDRNKKSVNGFLQEFETMNIVAQDYLLQEPRLLKTTAESLSAFSDTFNEDLDLMQFNEMNKTLAKLEIALKHYDIENIATPVIERPSCDPSLARGWMSNGFWNVSCIEYVKNFSKVYNIKYSSKKQLLSLYEAMQRLQRTEYRNTLIGIILRDVIPAVKSNIDPTSAEYARAYKTIFVLCQDLNPEVPVLVRTDS